MKATSIRTGKKLPALVWLATLAVLLLALPLQRLTAQQAVQQKAFDSPGAAALAMIAAAKADDKAQLAEVFGPTAQETLSSGDPVADKNDRQHIVDKYEEMHRLVVEPDNTVTLYVGAENWPFPIPIVKKSNGWVFDTPAGAKEMLFRRIGRNENTAIDTLNVLVAAQKEYAAKPHDSSPKGQYAEKILSDEGKQNGLYWKTAEGQPQSPIGPLIAQATSEGYAKKGSGPTPFHGYIFRVLRSQGKNAAGGAKSYMSDGKMTGGFAFIAYPASYRNSGVMKFVVNQTGQIYQKDLGPRTTELAEAMKVYNPDRTWSPAE